MFLLLLLGLNIFGADSETEVGKVIECGDDEDCPDALACVYSKPFNLHLCVMPTQEINQISIQGQRSMGFGGSFSEKAVGGEVAVASESREDTSGSDSAEAQEAVGKTMLNPYHMKAQEAVGKPMMNPYYMKSEVEVAGSCAGTSVKLGTTSDKIGGTDAIFACQDIGLEMTNPLSVQNGNVYVCCVSRSVQEAVGKPMANPYYMKAQEAVGKPMANPYYMKAQEAETLAYTSKRHEASPLSLVNLFAALGFAMTVYGAFRYYVK